MNDLKRFQSSVKKTSTCWLWQGTRSSAGYGRIVFNGRQRQAHGVAFELSGKTVPRGLELDHKCRVKACVNPKHLRPITHRQNIAIAKATTHCPQGHKYNKRNTQYTTYTNSKGYVCNEKHCRVCGNQRSVEYRRRKRERDSLQV